MQARVAPSAAAALRLSSTEHPEDFAIQLFLRDTIDGLLRGGGAVATAGRRARAGSAERARIIVRSR